MINTKTIIISIAILILVSGTAMGNLSGGVTVGDTTSNAKDVVITISGNNPITVERYTAYGDSGAVAIDPETNQAVTVNSTGLPFDTQFVGTFNITYSATGSNGNTTTANRTIIVIDTKAPDNVRDLGVASVTWKSITITWNNPDMTMYPNQDYAGVVITVSTGNPLTPVTGLNKLYIGSPMNYTIEGLKAGTTYSILVQSVDDQEPNHPGNGT